MPKRKFSLEFDMENACFQGDAAGESIFIILDQIRRRVRDQHEEGGLIFDVNGNKIGQWSMDAEHD